MKQRRLRIVKESSSDGFFPWLLMVTLPVISPILYLGKVRPRKGEQLARGHMINSENVTPRTLVPELTAEDLVSFPLAGTPGAWGDVTGTQEPARALGLNKYAPLLFLNLE